MVNISATTDYKDLMKLGFPKHTSQNIIKQAKIIAVEKFEEARKDGQSLVELGRSPFDNQRLGIAPTTIVEELIGIPLSKQIESGK